MEMIQTGRFNSPTQILSRREKESQRKMSNRDLSKVSMREREKGKQQGDRRSCKAKTKTKPEKERRARRDLL